ncbi:MAG TPA: trehalose-phosphatase [Acidimicrobiales bacterium]|nr:trehalose-phosphatase [Acidimicrobiales bacterium]
MTSPPDLLAPFRARPERAAVVTDFDGTLSPIVDDPAAARPVAGAAEALGALVGSYGLVAVMSGRPVEFLVGRLPGGVVLSGLYGLEVVRDGVRTDHAGAGAWRTVVDDVVRASVDGGPAGMHVESKGLSLTLHFRTRPDLEPAVLDWARAQAARSGLEVRRAKMSIELHPPLAADKGTALEALTAGLAAVCFVGDDRGDLPAYDALDRLAASGVTAVRVGVASSEVPDELVARSDLMLDGPPAVVELLRSLDPRVG